MWHFVLIWLVTTVSLLIIARLPLGIDIKDFSTALVTALVLGVLNALLRPVLGFFFFPITFLTLGLFSFVLNAIVFWGASVLVNGFHLRAGFLSALIGPIVLGILNAIMLWFLR